MYLKSLLHVNHTSQRERKSIYSRLVDGGGSRSVQDAGGLATCSCAPAPPLNRWATMSTYFSPSWAHVSPFFQWERWMGKWPDASQPLLAFCDDWRGRFSGCFYVPSVFATKLLGWGVGRSQVPRHYVHGGGPLPWKSRARVNLALILYPTPGCLWLSCEQLLSTAIPSLGINKTKQNKKSKTKCLSCALLGILLSFLTE